MELFLDEEESLSLEGNGPALEILVEGQEALQGWCKVSGHSVWDVKMTFKWKAR